MSGRRAALWILLAVVILAAGAVWLAVRPGGGPAPAATVVSAPELEAAVAG